MGRHRKRSNACFTQKNYFRRSTVIPKEYHSIWHWNDKTRRRFLVEKLQNSNFYFTRVTLKDDFLSEAQKSLNAFKTKWKLYADDDSLRQSISWNLIRRPNEGTLPPKKKLLESNKTYAERCIDFLNLEIAPSEDEIEKEIFKWVSYQKKAVNSIEYTRLQNNVKRENELAQNHNKERYLELIEISTFNDDDHMKHIWSKIRGCCEKDESLRNHYLSLQLKKENAWILEKEKREKIKKLREKHQEKQVQERNAMLARANQETRLLGAKVKFRLSRDHDCPYCNGELGLNPHADHIIPVAQGGLSVEHNMVYVCQPCNSSKSDLTLFEFTDKKNLDYLAIIQTLKRLGKRV